jgi:hypothetical protein
VKGEKGATGTSGAKGATGASGATGFTEKLPSGKTEMGAWAMTVTDPPNAEVFVKPYTSISFTIPLKSPGGVESTAVLNQKETEEGSGARGCTGTVEAPTAPPGKLCVYTRFEEAVNTSGGPFVAEGPELLGEKYGVSGVILSGPKLEPTVTGSASLEAFGSWAVTAP